MAYYLAVGTALVGTTFTEVSDGSYARIPLNLPPISQGRTTATNVGSFTAAGTFVVLADAMFDAPTGGNMLMCWHRGAVLLAPGSPITHPNPLTFNLPDTGSTNTSLTLWSAGSVVGTFSGSLTGLTQTLYAGVALQASGGLLAISATGGGGGATAYSQLTGLPTLGSAAAANIGTAAGTVAAGNDTRITGTPVAVTAAGTTQSGATVLASQFVTLTVASGQTAVQLAAATIEQNVANTLQPAGGIPALVFPPSGGTINGLATNAGLAIPGATAVTFRSTNGVAFTASLPIDPAVVAGLAIVTVSNSYTAAGAIAITDTVSKLRLTAATTYTLAAGTVPGAKITLNNVGSAAATVTVASFYGTASYALTLGMGSVKNLYWDATDSTYYFAS